MMKDSHAAPSSQPTSTSVIVTVFTDIAGTIGMPVIAVVAMVVLGIKRRSWTPVVLIIAAGAGSLLMTIAGKELIQRQRPPLIDAVPPFEYSPSFPSRHTLNAVAVVGIIAYLLVLRRGVFTQLPRHTRVRGSSKPASRCRISHSPTLTDWQRESKPLADPAPGQQLDRSGFREPVRRSVTGCTFVQGQVFVQPVRLEEHRADVAPSGATRAPGRGRVRSTRLSRHGR